MSNQHARAWARRAAIRLEQLTGYVDTGPQKGRTLAFWLRRMYNAVASVQLRELAKRATEGELAAMASNDQPRVLSLEELGALMQSNIGREETYRLVQPADTLNAALNQEYPLKTIAGESRKLLQMRVTHWTFAPVSPGLATVQVDLLRNGSRIKLYTSTARHSASVFNPTVTVVPGDKLSARVLGTIGNINGIRGLDVSLIHQ
jgi:hypothetical protein